MKLAVAFALMTTGVAAQGCPTVADFTDGIIARDTALAEMYLFKQVDGQFTRSLLTYATAPNPVTQPTDTYDMSRLLPFAVYIPEIRARYCNVICKRAMEKPDFDALRTNRKAAWNT